MSRRNAIAGAHHLRLTNAESNSNPNTPSSEPSVEQAAAATTTNNTVGSPETPQSKPTHHPHPHSHPSPTSSLFVDTAPSWTQPPHRTPCTTVSSPSISPFTSPSSRNRRDRTIPLTKHSLPPQSNSTTTTATATTGASNRDSTASSSATLATATANNDATTKLAEALDDFLGDVERKFKGISDEILTRLDEMAERCDRLEGELLRRDIGATGTADPGSASSVVGAADRDSGV